MGNKSQVVTSQPHKRVYLLPMGSENLGHQPLEDGQGPVHSKGQLLVMEQTIRGGEISFPRASGAKGTCQKPFVRSSMLIYQAVGLIHKFGAWGRRRTLRFNLHS